MLQETNRKLVDRARFTKDLVIVDGITRTGKFLVAHIVSSLEGMEYFQYPYLLETLQYLHRHGKVPFETARALLHADLDNYIYNMMIGRGLNSRGSDLSKIENSIASEEFISRAKEKDEMVLLERWHKEKRLPVMIGHEGLCNFDFTFAALPEAKVVNMMRDPVALAHSWFKRGWGGRWGTDPKALSIVFEGGGGKAVPWFAIGWEKEYLELSEFERVVRSLEVLIELGKNTYQTLEKRFQNAILFVRFEDLLQKPDQEVRRISQHLGRKPRSGIERILQRERLPREVALDEREKNFKELGSHLTHSAKNILERLASEYDGFWTKLTSLN